MCATHLTSYIYIEVLLVPYRAFTSPISYSSGSLGFHSGEKKSIDGENMWKLIINHDVKFYVEITWLFQNCGAVLWVLFKIRIYSSYTVHCWNHGKLTSAYP